MSFRFLLFLVAIPAIVLAQIDRTPVPMPGSGSGGPWGTSPRLPSPFPGGRGRGTSDRPSQDAATTRSTGRLSKIDDKTLVVEAQDGRTLEFSRSRETKFYKDAKEIGASELKAGDQVTVESTEDQRGRLYAKNVYWEAPPPAAAETVPGRTQKEPPRDSDDPGPPVLKRGVPEPRQKSQPEVVASAPVEAPPVIGDPYIRKARTAAASFSEDLPKYVCKEVMARFVSDTRPVNWRALDVITMEVVYEGGKESYRDINVNNRPVNKKIEELGGAWSSGEFASTLLDIFSPLTGAEFRFGGQSTVAGVQARVYDFTVEQPYSHWHVKTESQSINPAYKGSVWIDPASGRALRIEMQTRELPKEFPLSKVESAVEYAKVRIGSREYLLPSHAESLSCQRGAVTCSRNTLDFRNYHKYEADSSIAFDEPKSN